MFKNFEILVKGTESVISSDPPCKDMVMHDLQRYTLINNVEDIVVFLGLKVFKMIPMCFQFQKKLQLKIISLKK